MSVYSTGTINVSAGGTAVTGSGTNWLSAGIRAGDLFFAAGLCRPIASVNSNNSLTLAQTWPGGALAGAAYFVQLLDDNVRSLVTMNSLLAQLAGGNLPALAGLSGAANKLAYFTGAGAMTLTDLSAWARSLLDDANVAAFWATIGATADPPQAFRRGNVLGTVSQASGVPTGALIERDNTSPNGVCLRLADGHQICRHKVTAIMTGVNYIRATWTFPKAFIAAPSVQVTSDISSAVGYGTGGDRERWGHSSALNPSTTSVLVDVYRSYGAPNIPAGSTMDLFVTAIGQWF